MISGANLRLVSRIISLGRTGVEASSRCQTLRHCIFDDSDGHGGTPFGTANRAMVIVRGGDEIFESPD